MIDDDDDLRGRFAAIADEGAPHLDEAARERVLERVQRDGPALAKPRRVPWGLVGVGLAAAAALLLFVLSRPNEPVASGPACAGWSAASAPVHEGRLDLGRRGIARVEGSLRLRASDPCETTLELDSGAVRVRADDLGGGTLRVEAGDVRVEVRGTRFTVTRDGADVEVSVEEGHVVVQVPTERAIDLHGGERWSRREPRAADEPIAPLAPATPAVEPNDLGVEAPEIEAPAAPPTAAPRTERARPATEPTEAPNEPPDARARLAQAEALWRGGSRDEARTIFRAVGAGRGALAEAAWLRLARLELRGGQPTHALEATRTMRRRFPSGRLGAEALWLQADAARRAGDHATARAAERRLRREYPDSPQARASAASEGDPTP